MLPPHNTQNDHLAPGASNPKLHIQHKWITIRLRNSKSGGDKMVDSNELDKQTASKDEVDRIRTEYRQTLYTLRQTQDAYGRLVPKDFLHLLGDGNILNIQLGKEMEKRLTVMFTDIRDFTTLSETMSPSETFAFLNAYLGYMEPPIQRHDGIIDKFIGDAVMALFAKTPQNAVEAAISMRKALEYFNQQREKEAQKPIDMGIGLNTGLSTLGILGHLEHMEATVIGDTVNVAQRIESLTKTYKVGILISEDTLTCLDDPDKFFVRFVDRTPVKGRIRPISVYEVFDSDPMELAKGKLATLDTFEKAVAYYHLREIDRALPLLTSCLETVPDDTVVKIYLERCNTFKETGIYDGLSELLHNVQWQDSFNTGIDIVDRQHQTLLININKLAEAIQHKDDKAAAEVFDFLESYAIEHFNTEVEYMRKYDYPFLEDHLQEHGSFVRSFTVTKQEILSGRHDPLLCLFRINLFLYDWLISHSTRIDKHFANYVLDKMRMDT